MEHRKILEYSHIQKLKILLEECYTPTQYTLSGNIHKHYALKHLRCSCHSINSCIIVSYLYSSLNKKPLATVNKILEWKYYTAVLPNALK